MPSPTADPRIADLVQSGRVRVSLFLPQYVKDPATGEIRGLGTGFLAIEIANALARQLGIAMQVIENSTPPKAVECLQTGACDLGFFGIEESRIRQIDFSPAVFQFDYTYLVPAGSTIRRIADADRPGVRIAVVRNHASASALGDLVKHAEIVGADLPDATFDLLRAGKADAFALPRENLLHYSTVLRGSRVLDEGYGVNRVGIAVAKGQPGRLAAVSEFVEQVKASGLVQRAIERGGLKGFEVSPPAVAGARPAGP